MIIVHHNTVCAKQGQGCKIRLKVAGEMGKVTGEILHCISSSMLLYVHSEKPAHKCYQMRW